jgi:hypothetical protein
MLPLASPCVIPPGIIGVLSEIGTVAKLHEILSFFLTLGDRSALSTLDLSPLIHEWLHTAHAEPLKFLTDWQAFDDIKDSFELTAEYTVWQDDYDPAPFREQQYAFLLQQLLRALAWHIHLDWSRAGPASDTNNIKTKRFERWLQLAYTPAFSLASSPLGQAPIEHTGELPFLRPLSTKKLRDTFGLEKFMSLSLFLPLLATFFVPFPVDPFVSKNFKNVELFTQADLDADAANGEDDQPDADDLVMTPSMLAFQSTVERKQRAATITVEASTPPQRTTFPQRKQPPAFADPDADASPGRSMASNGPTAHLPPIVQQPSKPPPYDQPDFHTGRTHLPMSPTRLSRQPTTHLPYPGHDRDNSRYSFSTAYPRSAPLVDPHSNASASGRWNPGTNAGHRATATLPPPYGCQGTPSPHNSFPAHESSIPRPRQERQATPLLQAVDFPPVLGRTTATPHSSQPQSVPSQWSLTDPDPRQP